VFHPRLTLDRLFPADSVLSGRPSPSAARWLRGTPALRDFLAGEAGAVAGDLPVLVGRGSLSPAVRELLAEGGLPPVARPVAFGDAADYLRRVASLAAGGARFALSHPHLPREVPPSAYVVPRQLLCGLNNKADLGDWVPEDHLARRRVVPLSRRRVAGSDPVFTALPVVVKAAVDEPTGGGTSVRICRTPADVEGALADFSGCGRVVVEEWIPHERSFNLQVAIAGPEEMYPLGGSEQVVTPEGRYRGNWLAVPGSPRAGPDGAESLVLDVAARAARAGYLGVAGFDVAVGADGRLVVFDANFRLNGSTPALLLSSSVASATGAVAIRYLTVEASAGLTSALPHLRKALRKGWFVPLNGFDPAWADDPEAKPWFSGLLLGADRAEVQARQGELASLGLA
jgi:hypothetical protein